jgi:hypothetical protein
MRRDAWRHSAYKLSVDEKLSLAPLTPASGQRDAVAALRAGAVAVRDLSPFVWSMSGRHTRRRTSRGSMNSIGLLRRGGKLDYCG